MKLYNTLTRKKERFKPIKRGEVKIYICGPTVYDYAHIGNLSTYLFVDLLIRYLKYSGYKVKSVMNITDIEDKIINKLRERNNLNLEGLKKFTEHYSEEFFKELKLLGIQNIDVFPKATEHISEMISMIEILIEKKLAYLVKDGSIYYRIKSFKTYSSLAQLDKQLLKKDATNRLNLRDEYAKEEVNDFVLWKSWRKEDGKIYWETPWGKGRPGWHIECSAMSIKNLGPTCDIHMGAVDLIFPHHTNEIAQSEGVTGQKFVNYWIHREHLLVDGKKMSKSLGNFYTLSDILKRNNNPLVFRYLILINHYRLNLNFTFDALDAANNSLKKIHNFVERLKSIKEKGTNKINVKLLIEKNRAEFQKFMNDDLNVAKSIASLFDFITKTNGLIDKNLINDKQAKEILGYLREIDTVWGFIFDICNKEKINIESKNKIQELIKIRENYRKQKEWKKADQIRDKITKMGFELIDEENKTIFKKFTS